jgi:hypothetical protein
MESGGKGVKNRKPPARLRALERQLKATMPLVDQGVRQTQARRVRRMVDSPGKMTPALRAAEGEFSSAAHEREAPPRGVKRVSLSRRSTKSAARRARQKKRWFRQGQKWRTGCEGRIHVRKRRHGRNRSCYQGQEGMDRWVGLGVVADILINRGRALASRKSG